MGFYEEPHPCICCGRSVYLEAAVLWDGGAPLPLLSEGPEVDIQHWCCERCFEKGRELYFEHAGEEDHGNALEDWDSGFRGPDDMPLLTCSRCGCEFHQWGNTSLCEPCYDEYLRELGVGGPRLEEDG